MALNSVLSIVDRCLCVFDLHRGTTHHLEVEGLSFERHQWPGSISGTTGMVSVDCHRQNIPVKW